jgi:hypothetical protein
MASALPSLRPGCRFASGFTLQPLLQLDNLGFWHRGPTALSSSLLSIFAAPVGTTVIVDTGLSLPTEPIDASAFIVSARQWVILNGTRFTAFTGLREVLSGFVSPIDELVMSGDAHAAVREAATGAGRFVVLNMRIGMVPAEWGLFAGVGGAPPVQHDRTDYLDYHVFVPQLAQGERLPLVL